MGEPRTPARDSRPPTNDTAPIVGRLVEVDEPILGKLVAEAPTPPPPVVTARPAEDVARSKSAAPTSGADVDDFDAPGGDANEPRGFFDRLIGFIGWCIHGSFCIVSLVVLLAVLTAIPLLQLIAFGYLLDVSGRLVNGGTFRQSLPKLAEAGMIGLAATAVFFASLPTQLLVHWESVSQLINPGSGQAAMMRVLAIAFSVFATGYLLWAWVRGGRLRHYLWPQPKRLMREGWRWSTWKTAPDRLWDFTVSLELPRLFWLGLRGFAATLIWLIPAMLIIAANRNGETGLAGVFGFFCLLALGVALMYLPMLQANFAAENRVTALFEVRKIRRDFRRAPWAWLVAMIIGLVLMPIPLYLLKIEATPSEVVWAPCLVFVAFILPARIAEGLALRRARRRPDPSGTWAMISRWSVRLAMPAVVGLYLVFVQVSQYTSWDGLLTWVQQHAILVPVPFTGGV